MGLEVSDKSRLINRDCPAVADPALRAETPALDFFEVIAQAFEDAAIVSRRDFAFHFRESEMDNIVMVNFLAGEPFAELKPDLVEERPY